MLDDPALMTRMGSRIRFFLRGSGAFIVSYKQRAQISRHQQRRALCSTKQSGEAMPLIGINAYLALPPECASSSWENGDESGRCDDPRRDLARARRFDAQGGEADAAIRNERLPGARSR